MADQVDQDGVDFDTADLRLTRAGASLRYRSDDGWTVKLPESIGVTVVRDELSFPGHGVGEPPEEAIGFVRAFAQSAPLQLIAQVRTHRRRSQLRDHRDRAVGELDDDLVRGEADGSDAVQFRELEFEVAEDANPKIVAKVLKRFAGERGPT